MGAKQGRAGRPVGPGGASGGRRPSPPPPARVPDSAVLVLLGGVVGVALALIGLWIFVGRGSQEPATLSAAELEADAVTVEPSAVDLGRVRLDVDAVATVRVVNRSQRTITLGRPTVETLEGC